MSKPDAPSAKTARPTAASSVLDEVTQRHLRKLEELAEIGLSMAEALRAQSVAVHGGVRTVETGEAFELIAREVCLSVAMADRLRRAALVRNRPALRPDQASVLEAQLRVRPGSLH